MATYNDTINGFHRDIEQLEDTVESKNIELRLLESERKDDLKPSVLASNISCTVTEMIMEILDFEKTKGKSERTKLSKQRLIKLLNDTEELNLLSMQIRSLKLINRQIHAQYQLMRAENNQLKQALKNIENAEQY